MQRPRIRFTIRGVMITVALTALVLTSIQLRRRQIAYQGQAASHRALEARYRDRALWADKMLAKGYISRRALADSREQADYHARMGALYERAAARPWLAVEPVPNE